MIILTTTTVGVILLVYVFSEKRSDNSISIFSLFKILDRKALFRALMTCIIFTFSFHACKPLICNTIHASNTNIYVFFHASWEEFFESQEIEENISIINQDTTIQTARNYNIFDSVFKKIHCSRAIHVSANSPKYILIESSSFQDVCSGDNDGGGAIFATHCYTVQNRVCGNNCSISSGRGTFSVVTGERGFLISSSIINCGINEKGQSTFCTVRCFTNISQSNVSHCKSETKVAFLIDNPKNVAAVNICYIENNIASSNSLLYHINGTQLISICNIINNTDSSNLIFSLCTLTIKYSNILGNNSPYIFYTVSYSILVENCFLDKTYKAAKVIITDSINSKVIIQNNGLICKFDGSPPKFSQATNSEEIPSSKKEQTPHITPFSTVHKTPFSTVHKTPFSTVHKTPFSTVHKTPFSTAYSTPFSTVHKTPFSTTYSTPFTTPEHTPVSEQTQTTDSDEDNDFTCTITCLIPYMEYRIMNRKR